MTSIHYVRVPDDNELPAQTEVPAPVDLFSPMAATLEAQHHQEPAAFSLAEDGAPSATGERLVHDDERKKSAKLHLSADHVLVIAACGMFALTLGSRLAQSLVNGDLFSKDSVRGSFVLSFVSSYLAACVFLVRRSWYRPSTPPPSPHDEKMTVDRALVFGTCLMLAATVGKSFLHALFTGALFSNDTAHSAAVLFFAGAFFTACLFLVRRSWYRHATN